MKNERRGGSLKAYLSALPRDVGSLRISEFRFGHNDHYADPPPSSLVMTSFTRRERPEGKDNAKHHRGGAKTVSRVEALQPMFSPHTASLLEPYRGISPDVSHLVLYHYHTRSFLRYMHRAARGSAIWGLLPNQESALLYHFATRMIEFNAVEDLTLAAPDKVEKVARHLESLGIWGLKRTERLRPYSGFSSMTVRLVPDPEHAT